MTPPATPETPRPAGLPTGARLLLTAACAVIVIAGLRAASSLVIPILIAGILSLLCYLPMEAMQRRGVPRWLSVVVVIAVAAITIVALVGVGSAAVDRFSSEESNLASELNKKIQLITEFLRDEEILDSSQQDKIQSLIAPGRIMHFVSGATAEFFSVLSNLFVILLVMAFMLVEAHDFGPKILRAFGSSASAMDQLTRIKNSIAGYLAIKSGVSLLTGVLVGVFLAVLGVDFPVLWGMVAFLFNFIPTIGSIIAAVPAVAVAWIGQGGGTALVVIAGYVAVNVVVGNVLEPRIMGQRLGLSTLVVFISLLFWSWVWGPVGMLLSVPLTVALKIVLAHIDDLRPIAVLLGPAAESADDEPSS